MKEKTLSERYGDEVLTDNTQIPKCEQCKDCVFRSDGTVWTNDYRKGSCALYPYPSMKPSGVKNNTEKCEYYEKE